ncbi:MAG: prepilin-type N-terminal cleavage/methylation domain-containing protein [Chthoniobacter sp.]
MKAQTSGSLQVAILHLFWNDSRVLSAAERRVNGAITESEFLHLIADACALSAKRFEIDATALAETITRLCTETTPLESGFTLVEPSIVLVIIGLLIGGILVAQSMISTSKITATIQQLGQFDAGWRISKRSMATFPATLRCSAATGTAL